MSFIAAAALFCDCGGGKIAALFCDCGEGARGSGAPRAARESVVARRSTRRRLRGALRGASRRASHRTSRRVQQGGVPDGLHLGDDFAVGARQRDAGRGCRFLRRVPRRRRAPSPGSRLTATGAAPPRARGAGVSFSFPFPRSRTAAGSSGSSREGVSPVGLFARPAAASAAAAADCASDGGSLRLLAGGTLRTSRAGRSVTFGIVVRSFVSLRASSTTHGSVGSSTSSSGSATAASVLARHSRSAVECLQLRGGCARARRDGARAETRLLRVSSERLRSRGGTRARNLHQRRCFVCFFLSVVGRVGVASSRRPRRLVFFVFFVFSAHAHAHVVRVARVGSRAGPDDGAVLLHARACRVELALRVDLLRRAREHARGDDPLRVETPGGNGSERRVASVFAGGCPRAPRGAVAARGRGDSWGAKRGGAHPLDFVRARQHRRIGVALAQPRPQ